MKNEPSDLPKIMSESVDTKRLLNNSWLTWPLIIGAYISLVAAFFILKSSKLHSCLEPECFSFFLTLIDAPIKIMSATLAYAALFTVVHRSNQTNIQINLASKQIELMLNQNTFKNYLDHKNEFMRVLTGLEDDNALTIRNKESLYISIFPKNNTQHMTFISTGKTAKNILWNFAWMKFQISANK